MSQCKCDIRDLMSVGHDAGCPEKRTTVVGPHGKLLTQGELDDYSDIDFEWLPPPDTNDRKEALFDAWYNRAVADMFNSCMVNLPELSATKWASKVYTMPYPIRFLDFTV